MPAITIRHVPEGVRDALAARATAAGKSLQEFLLGELTEMAARPSVEDLLAAVRRRKAAVPADVSTDEILESLEDGRR